MSALYCALLSDPGWWRRRIGQAAIRDISHLDFSGRGLHCLYRLLPCAGEGAEAFFWVPEQVLDG